MTYSINGLGQMDSDWGQKLSNPISQYIKIYSRRIKSKIETAKVLEETIWGCLSKSDWKRPSMFDTI